MMNNEIRNIAKSTKVTKQSTKNEHSKVYTVAEWNMM